VNILQLISHSSRLSPTDVDTIARVVDSQLTYHVAARWEMTPWRMLAQPWSGAFPMVIFDHADQADALGYHDVDPHGHPYGRVFVDPILQNGGGVLDGVGGSVSATVSHEAIEVAGDQYANVWTEMPDGREVARELADPVEQDAYILRLSSSGLKAQVSSFVLPNWFSNAEGPYDYMGRLSAPWTMSPGGYLIVRSPGGKVSNVWGASVPEWRKAAKQHAASRTVRRASAVRFPAPTPAPPERPQEAA
jgi:hypothetical protein